MAFVPIDKRALVNELRRGIIEIVFVGGDNVVYNAKCTFGEDFPKQSPEDQQLLEAELSSSNTYLPVWNVITARWGAIDLNKIISVQLA